MASDIAGVLSGFCSGSVRVVVRGLSSALVVACWLSVAGLARAEGDVAEKTLSPYFFVEGGDSGVDSLPLLATNVDVSVSGVIANVRVTQVYKNAGKHPLNARYVFPASTRAAVHGLQMKLGERTIRAKIKEREQAKNEFEQAKRDGKTATLLEQDRPNVFSMGIANVIPGDRIEVTLDYTELLVPEGGTYEFVYPTVVGPRYSHQAATGAAATEQFVESPYLHAGESPRHELTLRGAIASTIEVSKMSVATHKVTSHWSNPKLVHFELDASEKQAPNRDFILRFRLAGDAIQSGLSLYEHGGEKFFLAMVQAPERVAPASVPPREFVFVVDVSGSMHGFPIDTAKVLLQDLVSHLRPVDTFNVLFFSGGSELMSPRSLPATSENIQNALAFLSTIDGAGGTELLPALRQALSLPTDSARSRSFLVITDGYIQAESEVFEHVRKHLGQANVYSFGIGSSVNRYLVEGIAKAGLGVPFVVTDPSKAPGVAAKLREYVSTPVLTKVRAKFDGFDAYDVEPAAIPDVLADRPVVLHGKWRGAPKGKVVLTGMGGAGPYRAELNVAGVQPQAENTALPYLWARTRIGNLTDFSGEQIAENRKKEVIGLGLRYNLLTQYTSFIAVAEEVRNTRGPAKNVTHPQAMPLGVSDQAVGVVGADEPELLWFFVLLCSVGVVGLRRRMAGALAS